MMIPKKVPRIMDNRTEITEIPMDTTDKPETKISLNREGTIEIPESVIAITKISVDTPRKTHVLLPFVNL